MFAQKIETDQINGVLKIADSTPRPSYFEGVELRPDLLTSRLITPESNPAPLIPLAFFCDGESRDHEGHARLCNLFYRGTLTMIKGQSGSRKSTLIRALLSVFLNGDSGNKTLTTNGTPLKIALIDTEQHPNRVSKFIRYIYQTAPSARDCLKAWACRGLAPEDMQGLIKTIATSTEWSPDVVIIDVITHLVDDVNDQKDSKQVIDFLNAVMNTTNAAIIGVIHQNPSSQTYGEGKATGAIGTKALQAAEMELQVERLGAGSFVDTETDRNAASLVTFTKYRDRQPDLPTFLLWNDQSREGLGVKVAPCKVYTAKNGNIPTDKKGAEHFFESFKSATEREWNDKFVWYAKTCDSHLSDFYNGNTF